MAKYGKKQDKGGGSSTIVLNNKAGHDFFIEQRFEWGLAISLLGLACLSLALRSR